MNDIRIGLIGCGGIAQKHMNEYLGAHGGHVYAVCDIDEARRRAAGEKCGVPAERQFADWRELLACPGVDAADICTPNNLHVPMARAAVDAGKPFCVEKPLGISYEETAALAEYAEARAIPSMICFSYRFLPAVRYARALVEAGEIGRVVHVYGQYLKSSAYMPGRRLDWRFVREIARYGVSGDLGVHMLDLATFLAGDVSAVCAETGIAVTERRRLDSDELAPVETDDWCHFLARIGGGASASFEITRAAYGNRNHIRVDVYGERGAFRFDLNHPERLEFHRPGTGENEMERIDVPAEYLAVQQQVFLDLLAGKRDRYIPTLRDGVRIQRVLDAILASADAHAWVEI